MHVRNTDTASPQLCLLVASWEWNFRLKSPLSLAPRQTAQTTPSPSCRKPHGWGKGCPEVLGLNMWRGYCDGTKDGKETLCLFFCCFTRVLALKMCKILFEMCDYLQVTLDICIDHAVTRRQKQWCKLVCSLSSHTESKMFFLLTLIL